MNAPDLTTHIHQHTLESIAQMSDFKIGSAVAAPSGHRSVRRAVYGTQTAAVPCWESKALGINRLDLGLLGGGPPRTEPLANRGA